MAWGFANIRGEWEIAAQFDDARAFSEGLAAVKRENFGGIYVRSWWGGEVWGDGEGGF